MVIPAMSFLTDRLQNLKLPRGGVTLTAPTWQDSVFAVGAGTLFLGSWVASQFMWHHFRSLFKLKPADLDGRGVLVTGCDSGIGRVTALGLAEKFPNLTVFAGCLTAQGCRELESEGHDNIVALELDVTSEESVDAAVRLIDSKLQGGGLHGVVNNAGILDGFYAELTNLNTFGNLLDVNYLGVVRVTKAFIPMLRESKGRVLVVTSLGAVIAAPTNGAYSGTKFAVKAFSEALRGEMRPAGVEVIQILPGGTRTPGLKNYCHRVIKQASESQPDTCELYGGVKHATDVAAFLKCYYNTAQDPVRVANAIERALTSRHPKAIYYVGMEARVGSLFPMVPQFTKDALFGMQSFDSQNVVIGDD